jgi:LPXTG-site transpeptidase (sortase) family protein
MEQPIFVVHDGKIKDKQRRKRKKWLIINGLIDGLIILSLVYLLLAYGPFIVQEANYYIRQAFGKTYILAEDASNYGPTPAASFGASVFGGVPEIAIEPKSRDFGVIITKIDVNEQVVPNVDPNDKVAYRNALKTGIAHAQGTAFPGEQNGNVYLFAHSTANVWDIVRYKSYFTLLRKLEIGDRVIVFYQGDRYDYEVFERKIIGSDDTSDLTGYAESPILTLQTCEPPGSDVRRLVVKAKLVGFKLAID